MPAFRLQIDRKRWIQLACILIALVCLIPVSPAVRPFAGNDSSVFLLIGRGILSGQTPYRDIWDHKPPIIFFINALGWLMTPNSTWGIFIIQVLFLAVCNLITFRLFQKRISTIFLLVSIFLGNIQLLHVLHGGNLTSYYTIPFQMAGFLLVEEILNRSAKFQRGALLGTCFILTLLCRPTAIGIFIAAAIVLLANHSFQTIKDFLRFLAGLMTGVLIILIPLIIFFASQNALGDVWDQVYRFNRYYTQQTQWEEIINGLLTYIRLFTPTAILPISIGAFLLVIISWIKTKKVEPIVQLAFFSFIIDLALVVSAGRDKVPYYLTLIPVSTVLVGIFFEKVSESVKFRYLPIMVSIISLILIGWNYRLDFLENYHIGDDSRRSKGTIVEFVQNNSQPSDLIQVWGTESWVYLYSDRKPTSKYIYVNPLFFAKYAGGEKIESFYQAILQKEPKYIIVTISKGKITDGFGANQSDKTREFAAKILSEYKPVFELNGTVIYQFTDIGS